MLIFCALTSCKSKSSDYFLQRGNELAIQLIIELEQVEDIDSLIEKAATFRRLFNEQADLIIEARKWQIAHKTLWECDQKSEKISRELENELKRVYTIPAACELIEQYQSSALERIDAFESRLLKTNQKVTN
jgi:hypothetical protein